MKINLMQLWKQNQDLNFGEMQEVVRAAEDAAEDKKRELIKAKRHKPSPKKKVDHLLRGMRMACGFEP